MTSDNWQKAKDIFNSALDLDSAELQEYLSAACGGDAALRKKVEDLLNSYESDFMEAPPATTDDGKAGRLPAGTMLGRYEIVRLIGSGGMGEVYLARDNQLDRKVAIKALNQKYESSEVNLKRFIQEAKAASALNHPNILTIHEIGEFKASHYIVSEFVEGKTLPRDHRRTAAKAFGTDRHCVPDRKRVVRRARDAHCSPRHQTGKHHGPRRRIC